MIQPQLGPGYTTGGKARSQPIQEALTWGKKFRIWSAADGGSFFSEKVTLKSRV
jgi:hypothetical protein